MYQIFFANTAYIRISSQSILHHFNAGRMSERNEWNDIFPSTSNLLHFLRTVIDFDVTFHLESRIGFKKKLYGDTNEQINPGF